MQESYTQAEQNYGNWFHGGTAPSGFLFADTSVFRNYQNWADQVVAVSTAPGVNNGCCQWVPWDGDYSTKFTANDGLVSRREGWYVSERWDGRPAVGPSRSPQDRDRNS